ncbi:unnamed protein product, partial [Cyprideis torosa]
HFASHNDASEYSTSYIDASTVHRFYLTVVTSHYYYSPPSMCLSTSLPTTTPPSTPPRTSTPPLSTEAASTSTPPPCARGPVPSIPSSPVQVVMKFDPHDDRPRRELLLPEEEPPSDTDDLQNEGPSASPSPLPAMDMVETMDTVEVKMEVKGETLLDAAMAEDDVQVVMKFDPHDDRPRRELLLPEEEPPSDT